MALLQESLTTYEQARRGLTGKKYESLGAEAQAIEKDMALYRQAKRYEQGTRRPESVYQEKSAAAADNAEAHYQVGLWCGQQKNMLDLSLLEFARAVELDPAHAKARERLGYVLHEDRWVTREDMMIIAIGEPAKTAEPPPAPEAAAKPLKELLADLKSADESVRLQAVKGLSKYGSEAACDACARAWKGETRGSSMYEAIREAMCWFKPRDVAGELEKFPDMKECTDEFLLDCVAMLDKLGGPDCARALCKYFTCKKRPVSNAAMAAFEHLGDLSVPHLAKLMSSPKYQGDVVPLLAAIRTEKAAAVLVSYLDVDHKPTPLGQSVNEALKDIGKSAVPPLIKALDDMGRKLWAAYMLREITGEPWGSADKARWIEWWRLHKDKDDEGEKGGAGEMGTE